MNRRGVRPRPPSLTPEQLEARLMKTAYRAFPAIRTATDSLTGIVYTTHHDVFTIGAGSIDLAAALANQDVLVGRALSSTAMSDSVSHIARLASTEPVILGGTATWSNTAVRGDSAVWGDTAIWGDRVTGEAAAIAIQGEN